MRTYRSKRGPLPEQIFYEVEEIENICRDELQAYGLYPSEPSPIRIDRFIEKRFKILPSYDDLPAGVLGFTRFGLNGVEEIVVAKALDEEGSKPAERRLRTTLAHEGGHGLLHAHLFVLGAKPGSLFGDSTTGDASKILCRENETPTGGTTQSKYRGRWWEFQANQAMSALLLPKALVREVLASELSMEGIFEIPSLPRDRRAASITLLAETFDVNPVVARIRLETLYPIAADQQLTL